MRPSRSSARARHSRTRFARGLARSWTRDFAIVGRRLTTAADATLSRAGAGRQLATTAQRSPTAVISLTAAWAVLYDREMKTLLIVVGLGLATAQLPSDKPSPTYPSPQQSLTERREVLKSVVAITTRPAADLARVPATQEIEHDSEVDRSEAVTVVVMMQGCQPDAQGACRGVGGRRRLQARRQRSQRDEGIDIWPRVAARPR